MLLLLVPVPETVVLVGMVGEDEEEEVAEQRREVGGKKREKET